MTTFETSAESIAEAAPALPLHDDSFYASPDADEALAELRRRSPVYRHEYEHGALWVLTRHADVNFVASKPELFSSSVPLIPSPPTEPLNEMLQGSLVVSDPPDHKAIRQAATPFFTRRRILARTEAMESYLAAAFDRIDHGRPFNLVDEISFPFPIFVIGEILGIPEEDRAEFVEATGNALAFNDPSLTGSDAGLEALMQSMAYFDTLLTRRSENPEEDAVSGMRELEPFTALKTLFQLLLGGLDTTNVLIAQGMLALLRTPDQLARLRRDPSLLPAAIEELLRWTTPINYFNRRVTAEVEIGGQLIAPGEIVTCVMRAANRDEEVFGPTADRLILDRTPNPHLSFGFGEHFCIGAHLARAETTLFFQRFLERFQTVELAGDPVRRPFFGQTNTLVDLPLVVQT